MRGARQGSDEVDIFAGTGELGSVGGLLITGLKRTEYLLNRAVAKAGVYPLLRTGGIGVLSLVVSEPGTHQVEIAKRTILDKSAVNLAVKGLEKLGWIYRQKIEGDRKRQALFATDIGVAELDRIVGDIRSIETRLLAEMPASVIDQLRQLLDQAHASCLARSLD